MMNVLAMVSVFAKNRNRLKMGTIPKIPVTKKGDHVSDPLF